MQSTQMQHTVFGGTTLSRSLYVVKEDFIEVDIDFHILWGKTVTMVG